jgi:hypothetical protein
MKWLITFLILFSAFHAYTQSTIKGTVTDKELSKPLVGISISIKAKGATTMLGFALTDEKGFYELEFKTTADSIVVLISGMNIKKQSETHPTAINTLNIKVDYESIVLKEIKVKPPKIRRLDDTLNYAVDQFTGKNDRTIGEALKRMPGITVAENGAITYNGKPINRFYIENQDLLEGRYGIATNNVEAKDVETVQVLENHQPIKALKNKEFTDEAAINIKLKKSAKDVFVANAQLGIGAAPLLWNNDAFGMKFGKSRQFIGTYKGNNTGTSSATELQNFYTADNNINFPVALGIQSPADPQVSRKRYLLNRDNAFSLNHLRVLKNDYKLTANLSYLNDRVRRSSYSRSENFLPGDSTLVIEEEVQSLEKFHYLDGMIRIGINKEKLFLENSLKFSGDIQRNEFGTIDNAQLIEQRRTAPYFRISNNLNYIKNYKETTFRINSYNGYGRLNDGLEVQPMLYPELFSDPGILTGMRQTVTQKSFVSFNNIAFGINQGRFRQSYVLGANANLINLSSALCSQTNLSETGNSADSLSNNLNWNRYELYVTPEYNYTVKKNNISLKLPLKYINQQSNDLISGNSRSGKRIFFTPAIAAIYHLNLLWQLNASASYAQSIDGLENGFNGYIMQSYRYLVRNEGDLPERSTSSYNTGISYRHPIKLLFASFSASYFINRMNQLYGNEFQGILSVRRNLNIPNTATGHNISFSIEKGLETLVDKISFNAGYNNSENTQLNQNVITSFNNKSYNAGVGLNAKFSGWGDLSYKLSYGTSENAIKNDSRDFEPIRFAAQRGAFNLFPFSDWAIILKYEYSFNSAVTGSGRIMNFADAGIRYKLKKLEFNVEYNNIFNIRRYIDAAYTGIGSYYASYDLRPTQVLLKVRMKLK